MSPSETFDNLAEFESRNCGKKLAIDGIPMGRTSFIWSRYN